MKASELTAQNLAEYARYSLGADEFNALPAETVAEISMALTASLNYVSKYCNIDLSTNTDEDLALAVLVVASEMLDNRQLTAQYSARNPLVLSILEMHRYNFFPYEEAEEGAEL